ncbi:MAG TPA: ABC transporter permease [Rubrobacter sp.]|jgi:ribose/xylose/arabinose/galactoside ABC-type transport system permease subunit|nr:ABC transporter permease [Rubrobacter sp.]
MTKTAKGTLARVVTVAGGRGGALIILFLLVVAFAIVTPDFLTVNNLINILRQYSVLMILAVGQTLVIVSRGIDLSVASTAALSGSVMGVAYAYWAWPEPASLLVGLAAGVAVGAFNGFVITRLDVPDFIATLGTFVAVRGIALLVTDGLPVPDFERAVEGRTLPGTISTLGVDSVLGAPLIAVVALVCALVGAFILARTRLGRSAYAIGGNTEAARMSGIKVERSKMWIYVFSGLLAAVGGFMLTGRQASANALMGEGLELQSIAAVVIGGTNLFGGEGRMSGTVIGVLIIGVLSNGLSIAGVAEFWQRVVNGLIIVAVVALDQWRRRAARAASS